MNKVFSFVFMGALGFSAALGAASLSGSKILNFNGPLVSAKGSVPNGTPNGLEFDSSGPKTSSFVRKSGRADLPLTTIGPFEDPTWLSFRPLSMTPVAAMDELPFFGTDSGSIASLSRATPPGGEPGAARAPQSPALLGFPNANSSFVTKAIQQSRSDASAPSVVPKVSRSIPGFTDPGTPFRTAAATTAVPQQIATVEDGLNGPDVGQNIVNAVQTVPTPAAGFLLGGALIGAGVWGRRKKRS